MSDKNPKKHIVQDILIFIGILVLLVFICRLWPIIFLIIIGIFISALRLLYLLVIQTEPQKNYPLLPEPQKEPDEEVLSDTQNHKSVKTRVNTEEPYIRH